MGFFKYVRDLASTWCFSPGKVFDAIAIDTKPIPFTVNTPVDRTDRRPICIYHKGDGEAYYASTPEIQDAWNDYAQGEADAFDNHPSRDSYDTTQVFPGWNRDGEYTAWCPALFFPEWLEQHMKGKQNGR